MTSLEADLIESLYAELEALCRSYLPTPARERIHRAYLFACQAHEGQRRDSGEPYITHPLTVAHYMAQQYLDDAVIVGALLHDVVEDTGHQLDEIERLFDPQTRHLVDGVTHLHGVSKLEDLAHLFLAMASDVRVVLIKLYDRLHNLRTLGAVSAERRRSKAMDTLNVYVPLAAKLGMWELKTEFETLILYHTDPAAHDMICSGIAALYEQEEPRLQQIAHDFQRLLRDRGLPCGIRIKPRSPYSIYQHLNGNRIDRDAFAKTFQIIIQVDSVPECYLAMGHLHSAFAHLSGSLVDTIGNPRDIFYRSLHTTIIIPRYKNPVPVRIRTYDFDRQSEIGILAQIQFVKPDEQKQPPKAPWLPQLPQIFRESDNPQRFVQSVFQDILQKQITCFTPRGEEISLPRGATILDFAYYVHTDIGHECRGGLVNGRSVDLGQTLSDGDHVEIVRLRGAAPHHEWLDDTLEFATTSRAKRKIREWFRHQAEESLVRRGQEILREERRRLNAAHVTAQRLAKAFNLDSAQTFYQQIGNGTIPVSEVARAILRYTPDAFTRSKRHFIEIVDPRGQHGWLEAYGDQRVRLAGCCQPLVNDEIIGHVREQVIMVHRRDCRAIMTSRRTDTLIRMEWVDSTAPQLLVYLRLEGYDRLGLMRDVSAVTARLGANIVQLETVVNERSIVFRLKLAIQTEDDLILIIHRLAMVQNISSVQRMSIEEIQSWEASVLVTR
jgi:GTP pyrophosphokinase